MVVITFFGERHRTDAFLALTMQFGSVENAGRWMRFRVTGAMMEELMRRGIPFAVVPESQIAAEKEEVESGSRLYDLRLGDYPKERGSEFRSVQVFVCWVCGALSNRVVAGGSPGLGVHVICPNGRECWHHDFEDKHAQLRRYLAASHKEKLGREIQSLRNLYAAEIQHDVRGEADMSQKRSMTKVRGYKEGCKHFALPELYDLF